jgi:hypothetical protein
LKSSQDPLGLKSSDLHKRFPIYCRFKFISPLPTKSEGTWGLHYVRQITFPHFFVRAFRYSFDIWYIALSYEDTDQVRVWF